MISSPPHNNDRERAENVPRFSVVTLVNDERLYALMRSTLLDQYGEGQVELVPVQADKHGWAAARALNHGIEQATSDWVVCAHQDVLFPYGWWERAQRQIAACGERVAVAGLVGITPRGRFAGHVLDPHGHCRWGVDLPHRVQSIDEHVIIVKKSSGVRFDNANPAFHCYGTDIAMEAAKRGLEAVVVDSPVVHLSSGRLDDRFWTAAQWLLNKWGDRTGGVLPTCAVLIKRDGLKSLPRRMWAKFVRNHFVPKWRDKRPILQDASWGGRA